MRQLVYHPQINGNHRFAKPLCIPAHAFEPVSAVTELLAELGLPKDDPIGRIAKGEVDSLEDAKSSNQSRLSEKDRQFLMENAQKTAKERKKSLVTT